ncbi:MAG: hypothetical protein ACLQBX_19010, partial [Candidatus Limnocylindrales bacterium]
MPWIDEAKEIVYADGSREPIDAHMLIGVPEAALSLLWLAVLAAALAMPAEAADQFAAVEREGRQQARVQQGEPIRIGEGSSGGDLPLRQDGQELRELHPREAEPQGPPAGNGVRRPAPAPRGGARSARPL